MFESQSQLQFIYISEDFYNIDNGQCPMDIPIKGTPTRTIYFVQNSVPIII